MNTDYAQASFACSFWCVIGVVQRLLSVVTGEEKQVEQEFLTCSVGFDLYLVGSGAWV
jgi:hypothetical protein